MSIIVQVSRFLPPDNMKILSKPLCTILVATSGAIDSFSSHNIIIQFGFVFCQRGEHKMLRKHSNYN